MSEHYPLKFTLEDGVHVVVNKKGENLFDFSLTPPEGAEHHFTLDENKSRDQITEEANFDELNAIRRFWLERTDII